MTKRKFMGPGSLGGEATQIDCGTCIHRKECTRAKEGTFCGQWQSRIPELKDLDPNKLWEQGEEVDF